MTEKVFEPVKRAGIWFSELFHYVLLFVAVLPAPIFLTGTRRSHVRAVPEALRTLLGHARNDDERGEVYIQKVTLDASEKHNSEAVATVSAVSVNRRISMP